MLIWLLRKVLETFFSKVEPVQIFDTECLLLAGNVDNYTSLDIESYFAQSAKHLLFFAEFFELEVARYQYDPRMILALMELYSGVVGNYRKLEQIDKPFGSLSRVVGFEQQVQDVFRRLSECIHGKEDSFSYPSLSKELHYILSQEIEQLNYDDVLQRFRLHSVYFELFEQAFADPEVIYEQILALSPEYPNADEQPIKGKELPKSSSRKLHF